jgi:hypothetical protein
VVSCRRENQCVQQNARANTLTRAAQGKRQVRANQVAVSHASLNSGDVFILDAGLKLYQWNGKGSNKYERAKALDVVKRIKDNERGGRAEIICVDEGGEDDDFWSALGGKGRIMSAEEAGDDHEAEKKFVEDLRVVPVTMAGKSPSFGMPLRPVKHAMLDSSGLVLVDTGKEIFAWVGKGADSPSDQRPCPSPRTTLRPTSGRSRREFPVLHRERKRRFSKTASQIGATPCAQRQHLANFLNHPRPRRRRPDPNRLTAQSWRLGCSAARQRSPRSRSTPK